MTMGKCRRKDGLQVHHKRRDSGNGSANAIVLCQPCHENTGTYGAPGAAPPAFSFETRLMALHQAEFRCQCASECSGCLT